MPLMLGTGGVLQRYDYVLTTNGMKANQYTDTQSDSAVYWFDNDRRELYSYTQMEVHHCLRQTNTESHECKHTQL